MDLFKKNLYWISCSIVSFLHFYFYLQFPWDLSSATRDQICTPSIGGWNLNHWSSWEVPQQILLKWHAQMFPVIKLLLCRSSFLAVSNCFLLFNTKLFMCISVCAFCTSNPPLSSSGLCSWDSSHVISLMSLLPLYCYVSVLFIIWFDLFITFEAMDPVSPWKYSFLWLQWQYYFKLFSTFKATQLISNLFRSLLCTNFVNTSVCRATFHTLDSLNSWQTFHQYLHDIILPRCISSWGLSTVM